MGRNSIPRMLTAEDQLCFMHIPKTGGLTLVTILDRFFREDEICPLHQAFWRLPREQLSKYRLIIAHGSYEELVSDRIPHPLFVTWLRHPIERTLSVYQYLPRKEDHEQFDQLRELSFQQYISADPFTRRFIDNVQSGMISGTPLPHSPSDFVEPDVALSKERLKEDFVVVGLTERYQESLDLLAYAFRWPKITEYELKNVAPDPLTRADVGEEAIQKIVELNRFDMELYEFGVELFKERHESMMQELILESSRRSD